MSSHAKFSLLIEELIGKYKKLKDEQRESEQMLSRLQEERTKLTEQLQASLNEKKNLERCRQHQINDIEIPKYRWDEVKDALNKMYTLSGYTIRELENIEDDLGNRLQRVKLHYNDNCYVLLEINFLEAKYKLIDIQPQPACFKEIKSVVESTHDVAGLLANMLIHFKKLLSTNIDETKSV